ncbi:MAG: hypothetical protein LBG15_07960 [Dysgonamonadaceae bacterium]|nr:hypothetical protein [Dysgonamonadaceae bacterium]
MTQVLSEEAVIIKDLQDIVVQEFNLQNIIGKDRAYLKGHFDLQASDTGCKLTLRYVKNIRYIDIGLCRKRGLSIYNRIVFGRIYRYTLAKLKYGFIDSIIESLRKELQGTNLVNEDVFIDTYYGHGTEG